jgi:DNA-binding LacI/PurR family transcriptional regulator
LTVEIRMVRGMNRLTIAVEALGASAWLGLNVPCDIAVVGCDDLMFMGPLSPTLTTLRVPKYDFGQDAPRPRPRRGE